MYTREIEDEAMSIRHTAALRLRKAGEIDGYEALAFIVAPTDKVREASLQIAEERLARSMPANYLMLEEDELMVSVAVAV